MSRSWMCQCCRSWRKSLRLLLTGERRQHGWTCIFGPGQIVHVPVPQVMEETVEAAMVLVVLPARCAWPGGEWPLPPEGTASGCRALRRRSVLVAAGLRSVNRLSQDTRHLSSFLNFVPDSSVFRGGLGCCAWAAAPGLLRSGRCACCCGGVLEVPMVCIQLSRHTPQTVQAHVAYNRDTHDPETRIRSCKSMCERFHVGASGLFGVRLKTPANLLFSSACVIVNSLVSQVVGFCLVLLRSCCRICIRVPFDPPRLLNCACPGFLQRRAPERCGP